MMYDMGGVWEVRAGGGGTKRRPQFEFAGQAWRCGGGRRVLVEAQGMDI
jgi:hypothetical protein